MATALVRDADGQLLTIGEPVHCPRCKRIAVGWPLKRADVCAPDSWALCIREPQAIQRKKHEPRP